MLKRPLLLTVMIAVLTGSTASAAQSSFLASNNVQEEHMTTSALINLAESKIKRLQALMDNAKQKGIDVTREEASLWMAHQYLTYANWDEQNVTLNKIQFESYREYKKIALQMAEELPDFERKEVIRLLDTAISNLTDAINGKVVRRPVPKMDWTNVALRDNHFVNAAGKPVFPYTYTWLPEDLRNDYLGNMNLGTLSPAIVSDEQGTIDNRILTQLLAASEKSNHFGWILLMHSLPGWALNKFGAEVEEGKTNYINYDIDNPYMREVWEHAIQGTVPLMKDTPVTKLGYLLANEPHWYSSKGHYAAIEGISVYTLNKFRKWLEIKHGSIEAINTLYGTNYPSFEEVTISLPMDPREKGTPLWYDWSRFNMDRVTEWFTFLHDEIKKYDPDAATHIKISTNPFLAGDHTNGIDLEVLTSLTEVNGNDVSVDNRLGRTDWEANYSFNWKSIAMFYDFMESISPDHPNINSEVHFLSINTHRDLEMKPSYVRSVYWLASILGMDAGQTWFWARNSDGSILKRMFDSSYQKASGVAYPGTVVQQPRVANELTQTMFDLNAFSEEMVAFQSQKKPIRIFYSETAALNDESYMNDQYQLLESMYFNGVPVGFSTKNVIRKQPNANWDVIVIRKTEEVTDEEFEAIQTDLDNGGTVIIDEVSLSLNEYKQPRATSLTASNGNLIREKDSLEEIANKAFEVVSSKNKHPQVMVTEENGGLKKGTFWRVVPSWEDQSMMTLVNLGKNPATIQLEMSDQSDMRLTNMMTEQAIPNRFTLQPEEVLLLNIRVGKK
jgi:beta-galactosidase